MAESAPTSILAARSFAPPKAWLVFKRPLPDGRGGQKGRGDIEEERPDISDKVYAPTEPLRDSMVHRTVHDVECAALNHKYTRNVGQCPT